MHLSMDPHDRLSINDLDLKLELLRAISGLGRETVKLQERRTGLKKTPAWYTRVWRGERSATVAELEQMVRPLDEELRRSLDAPATVQLLKAEWLGQPLLDLWTRVDTAVAANVVDSGKLHGLRRNGANRIWDALATRGNGGAAALRTADFSDIRPPLDPERFIDVAGSPDIPRAADDLYAGGTFTLSLPVGEPGPHRLWLFALRDFVDDVVDSGPTLEMELLRWSPAPLGVDTIDNGATATIQLRDVAVGQDVGRFLLRAVAAPFDVAATFDPRPGAGASTPPARMNLSETWNFLRSVDQFRRSAPGARLSFVERRYRVA